VQGRSKRTRVRVQEGTGHSAGDTYCLPLPEFLLVLWLLTLQRSTRFHHPHLVPSIPKHILPTLRLHYSQVHRSRLHVVRQRSRVILDDDRRVFECVTYSGDGWGRLLRSEGGAGVV
jgi:hypothetical protein